MSDFSFVMCFIIIITALFYGLSLDAINKKYRYLDCTGSYISSGKRQVYIASRDSCHDYEMYQRWVEVYAKDN